MGHLHALDLGGVLDGFGETEGGVGDGGAVGLATHTHTLQTQHPDISHTKPTS